MPGSADPRVQVSSHPPQTGSRNHARNKEEDQTKFAKTDYFEMLLLLEMNQKDALAAHFDPCGFGIKAGGGRFVRFLTPRPCLTKRDRGFPANSKGCLLPALVLRCGVTSKLKN